MPPPLPSPLLRTQGLSKDFGGIRVLHDISLDLRPGVILGLIGENGAGKSTLTKLLNGTHQPSAGSMEFDGQPVTHMTADRAQRLGINTIPQEFNLVDDLSVAENIFLGREYRKAGLFLDRRAMHAKARELLAGLRSATAPDARVRDLSAAGKQIVEIAKAVVNRSRLLIMDEPTTVLTPGEVAVLFDLMRDLKAGGTAILYISHKLAEVKRICDEVMVLRDGRFVSRNPAAELDEREMARRMVGREMSQMFPPRRAPGCERVFEVRNLSVPGRVHDVSFDVRRGEVLGFAGLVGAGRTEMAEGIMGIRRTAGGEIRVGGEAVRIRSPRMAVRHGLAYLPEDRQGAAILTGFGVTANITLSSLRQYGRWFTDRRRAAARAAEYVERFAIKTSSLETRLEHLSGGNQQKVALSKGLDTRPRVFLFDEPTRGIDINARSEIYAFIRRLAESGVGCVLISSDLEEILGLCDRVAVMREGRLAGFVEGHGMTEEAIMLLATGAGEPGGAAQTLCPASSS